MYKIYTSEDYDREDLPNNVWCVIRRLNELNLTPDIYDIKEIDDLDSINDDLFDRNNSIIVTKTFGYMKMDYDSIESITREMINAQFDKLYEIVDEQNKRLEDLGFIIYEKMPIITTTRHPDEHNEICLEYHGMYMFTVNEKLIDYIKEYMSDYNVDTEDLINDVFRMISEKYDSETSERLDKVCELLKMENIDVTLDDILYLGKGTDSEYFDVFLNYEQIAKYDEKTNMILFEEE